MRKSKRHKLAKLKRASRREEAQMMRRRVFLSSALLLLKHGAFLELIVLIISETVTRSSLRHEKVRVRLGSRVFVRDCFNY